MKVSIVTVCFNSEQTIGTTINSVLAQTYDNIEYIIVDGASTDDTIQVITNYGDKVTRLISEPDQGIYDAMNKGIALATGGVIGILNSDDFYPHADVVNEVVSAFESSPLVTMVLGNVEFVSPDQLDKPVRYYSSFNFKPWNMRFGFMPAHPAAFIRRSTYEKVGNYKLGYNIAADFEWFARAFLVDKISYAKLDKTLVRMREGGVSTSGFKSYWVSTNEMLRSLKENNIYSNTLFVLMRLPVKFIQVIRLKLSFK